MKLRPRPLSLGLGLLLALALPPEPISAAAALPGKGAREFLTLAEERRFAEDWYGAVDAYLAALEQNPSFGEALVGLAECYYRLEEYDQALDYARKAAPFKRGDPVLADLEGFILVGLGDLPGARARFEGVLSGRPNDIDARFGLSLLDLAAGKKTEARGRLEESLRLSPQNARALLSLALIAQDQGRREEAKALVERALRYHGGEPRVQLGAARIAAGEGDAERAAFHARNALDLKPAYAEARRFLGSLMYEAGDFEASAILMREAVSRDRRDAAAWFTLGLAQASLGRAADAVYSLKAASALLPDDELVRIALENLVADTSPLESSAREPYAEWHFVRGAEFEDRSYFDQALFEYRRGLKIYPYSKRGRVLYAELERKRGLPAKQLAELRFLETIGKADRSVLDSIEIYGSLLSEGVGSSWGVDQYALPKRPYKLALFYLPDAIEGAHTAGESILLRYLADLLSSSSRLSVLRLEPKAASQSEAFRRAREAEADYYLILSARDSDREVELGVELRVARTGSPAASYRAYRTGNDRVKNTAARIVELLSEALTPKGAILKRSQDRALVDLGAAEGFKAGDRLLVLKKGGLEVRHEGLGPAYPESAIVGTLTLTRLDEELAEGRLQSSGFFDTINVGDEVIPAPPGPESGSAAGPASGGPAGTKPSALAPGPESSLPGLFTAIKKLR